MELTHPNALNWPHLLCGEPACGILLDREPEEWVAEYEAWHRTRPGNRQQGAYYTPAPIAAYLTRRTLGERLNKQRVAIEKAMAARQWDQAQALLKTARHWQIMDPACGSGIFLLEALKHGLAFEHGLPEPLRIAQPARHIVAHQLHGVDVDPLAVAVARLRLSQWALRLDGQKQGDLALELPNIRCEDTLLSGNPALQAGRWDIILGNPPYLSEVRRQSGLFRKLARQGDYYRAKMDLCDAFLAWSLDHMQPDGLLGLVMPAYWTQRSSTRPLREHLTTAGTLKEVWQLDAGSLFAAAPGHHTSLLIWENRPGPDQQLLFGQEAPVEESRLQAGRWILQPGSGKLLIAGNDTTGVLSRLSACPPLLAPETICQGVVIPQGRLKARDQARLNDRPLPEAGFLLTDEEVMALGLSEAERGRLRPFHAPAGFAAFTGWDRPADYRLIYGDRRFRKEMAEHPELYPRLKKHLDDMAAVNTSAFAPYGLHRPRQPEVFDTPHKLLCPRQVAAPAVAPVRAPAYVAEGFYVLQCPPEDLDWICAVLNSDLAAFWFYHQKRKGMRLQIDKDVLAAFPAPPHLTPKARDTLTALSRMLQRPDLSPRDRRERMKALNETVLAAYHLTARDASVFDRHRRAGDNDPPKGT